MPYLCWKCGYCHGNDCPKCRVTMQVSPLPWPKTPAVSAAELDEVGSILNQPELGPDDQRRLVLLADKMARAIREVKAP